MLEKLVLAYRDQKIEKLRGRNYKNGRNAQEMDWKLQKPCYDTSEKNACFSIRENIFKFKELILHTLN